jgi:N-acyl amino acid synthase of PEP-CTERM/exosortase system
MDRTSVAEAVSAVREEFLITPARTPELIHEAFRLRRQVYCVERGYEPVAGDFETDEFDDRSSHIVLRQRNTGQVIGTARIVLPVPESPDDSFPMQRVCDPGLLRDVPLRTTGEVSRFAISKLRREMNPTTAALMRLGLVQGLVRLSRELGITHWCAIMERSLLRLLRSSAIYFRPIGPLVDYHGLRQPSVADLDALLQRVGREQPEIWSFLTENDRIEQRLAA